MSEQAEQSLPGSCAGSTRDTITSLEWLVMAIGARGESTSLQWSPFGRSLLALMDEGRLQPASPCLEMLPRTASVARHYGWAMPSTEIGAFLLGGWSEAQLDRLIESVCPHRPSMDPRPRFGEPMVLRQPHALRIGHDDRYHVSSQPFFPAYALFLRGKANRQ